MSYADKFTEGQRVQCIEEDGAMSINVGDTGTVVEHGRIKLDRNGYVGGWWHRRFKEIEEVAIKYKVGQRIIVTNEATWAQGLAGIIAGNKTSSSGNFMGYLVTFDDNTKNIHGDRVFWNDHELTLEAKEAVKEFKVGNRVEVIDSYGKTIADNGDLGTITSVDRDGYIGVNFDNGNNCIAWRLSRFITVKEEPPKTMSVTEALHAVVDGKTVIDDAGSKIYMVNNVFYLKMAECAERELCMYLSNYPDSQWKIYVEPPTPKFTPRQLIQNSSGTLGIIMEYKGDLRYSVRFSGLEGGTVKIMDESELSKVDL